MRQEIGSSPHICWILSEALYALLGPLCTSLEVDLRLGQILPAGLIQM